MPATVTPAVTAVNLFCNARRDHHVTDTCYHGRMAKRELGTHFLRQWRDYRGLSLRKLADKMESEPGVPLTSHANIGRIETFQQPYSQEILEAAADALECSVIELLTVDPTANGRVERSPETQLRSALLAFGVDPSQLGRAVSAVKLFINDLDEQSESDLPHGQSEPSNRRRVKVPSE